MARVLNILTRARDTLAEKTPKRWTTPRLLRVLSEAQKKIAQETLCVREVCTIEMCHGYHTYKLDITNVVTEGGTAIAISAVRNHEDDQCLFVITSVMKEINKDWRTEIDNDITHIIYNKQKPLIFRVHPIPDSSKIDASKADVFNTTNEPFADAAAICQSIAIQSNFDIVEEIAPIKMLVEFFHVPPPIVTVEDTNLLIPDYYDIALKHYVVGMTLRDDLDAQNRQMGAEELKLFESQYAVAMATSNANWTDQTEEHYAEVGYNAKLIEPGPISLWPFSNFNRSR